MNNVKKLPLVEAFSSCSGEQKTLIFLFSGAYDKLFVLGNLILQKGVKVKVESLQKGVKICLIIFKKVIMG